MAGKDAKMKWEMPMMFSMGGLPEAWGDCVAGSTETGGNACVSGQSTHSSSHFCGTGDQPGDYDCGTGSSPSPCSTGSVPAWGGGCSIGSLADTTCSSGTTFV
jgi:hypothetical protein